ncbi:MAG: MarR family transcriptional regulator [Candidatus Lokiarchaeota archaeon]|nr:MarR family transcriptional regulator [Candidatus Lokiarchaeota archaeon]MBD3340115.1 MarR family transcriptional regulator [Candidatus Lokiarchaeota archaeon]
MKKLSSDDSSEEILFLKVIDLIRKLEKQLNQIDRISFRIHGVEDITPPQMFILRQLWMEDGLQLKELAERGNCSRATMTGVVDSLEKKGYILRTPNLEDRRSYLIKLTSKGKESKEYKLPIDKERKDYFRAFSTEDLNTLYQLLKKLLNSIQE